MRVDLEYAPGELAERLDEVLDRIRLEAENDRGLQKGRRHAHGERHPTEGITNPELASMIEVAVGQAKARMGGMWAAAAVHLHGGT